MVKARDGQTDLYGLMFRPSTLDQNRKYPIVNQIYPGPQTGSVGSRDVLAGPRRHAGAGRARLRRGADRRHGHAVALEEVPRGVLRRHGRQHAARPGRRDEAARGEDTRTSTSTGPASGATPAAATPRLTRCSAIPTSSRSASPSPATTTTACTRTTGPRSGWGCWRRRPTAPTNYDTQANQALAKNLKGHLLLAHGTMDNNVPPNNTLLVVDALIKANKDFDLLMLPNQAPRLRHAWAAT